MGMLVGRCCLCDAAAGVRCLPCVHVSFIPRIVGRQVDCEGCDATLQKELVLNPHFRQVVEERVARVCAPRCELQDAAKIQPGPKVVPLPDPSPPYYVFVVALVLLLLLWRRLKADRV